MRKSSTILSFIVILIIMVLVSCDKSNELFVQGDPILEQTQTMLSSEIESSIPTGQDGLQNEPQDAPNDNTQNESQDETHDNTQDETKDNTHNETQDETKDESQDNENEEEEIPYINCFPSMKEAYYYKYQELANEYGTHILIDVSKNSPYFGSSYLSGVCIVNLMDFNGDGIEDLFIVYSNGQLNKINTGGSVMEIYDFPARDTYEVEIWTYDEEKLVKLFHDSSISNYIYDDPILTPYYQSFLTVYENKKGFPVIQVYNEGDNDCEFTNIYYSDGAIIRDKFAYSNQTFYRNDLKVAESIWKKHVFGYNKILMSSFLGDASRTSDYLFERTGVNYELTLMQTEGVINYLSKNNRKLVLKNFKIVEGEYISLYLEKIFYSNWIFCDYYRDPDEIYKNHKYNLYDIDQNGVPELILYDGIFGATMHSHFYTVIDSEIIFFGGFKRESLYVNDEGGLLAYSGRMGDYDIYEITLEGATLEAELAESGSWELDPPMLEDFGYENYKELKYCHPAIPFMLYEYE